MSGVKKGCSTSRIGNKSQMKMSQKINITFTSEKDEFLSVPSQTEIIYFPWGTAQGQ